MILEIYFNAKMAKNLKSLVVSVFSYCKQNISNEIFHFFPFQVSKDKNKKHH